MGGLGNCLNLDLGGFWDLWMVARIHCLNLDLGGFVDFRMVVRIHCLNRDLVGFMDLRMFGVIDFSAYTLSEPGFGWIYGFEDVWGY